MAKKQFKAESKRLLNLMINSIYTHKEIFLREIISNASDAIDKLCYISLTDDKVGLSRSDFRILIKADKENGTLTVSDNGIGMTAEELESNLGIIARSGSSDFKKETDEKAPDADIDIIGQFGVGFYSAFMVSDKVTVITKAYGAAAGYKWESSGADGYTITEYEKDFVGTDVIMHLKPDADGETYGDYLESFRIKQLVKKYSDYIRHPIITDVEKSETRETGEKDEKGNPKTEFYTVSEEQTVNSMIPLWHRSKTEATDEECISFYKEQFRDFEDPVCVIRVNAEGAVSYKAMLFIPEKAPYDYFTREYEAGLRLYCGGVMIMEKCADLIPDCFRFVRGVTDSPDLSLNISREMLQHDRQLKVIANSLEKKIKSELLKLMENEPDKYESFYKNFGIQLKYGVVSEFGAKKELLKDLIMFNSSKENELIPLSEYVKKMPEEQKFIYYVCAESVRHAEKLPQTEQVRERGYEILYLTEDVDEFVIQTLNNYESKAFCNISVDDLGLETEDEKKESEEKEKEAAGLLDFVKESLGDEVSVVRLSRKLKNRPVYLATEGGVTLEMEKYFKSLPGDRSDEIKATRVLEINGDHSAFRSLKAAYENDKEKAAKLSKILLSQAQLIAGLSLDDPSEYTEIVCSLF
ncbi:MAG: molecular chaperone HtpG [Oscillospiraceae bacterium]|nr:molecular chaperone HtpG [Oscillospiraceae bacterium]